MRFLYSARQTDRHDVARLDTEIGPSHRNNTGQFRAVCGGGILGVTLIAGPARSESSSGLQLRYPVFPTRSQCLEHRGNMLGSLCSHHQCAGVAMVGMELLHPLHEFVGGRAVRQRVERSRICSDGCWSGWPRRLAQRPEAPCGQPQRFSGAMRRWRPRWRPSVAGNTLHCNQLRSSRARVAVVRPRRRRKASTPWCLIALNAASHLL